MWTATIETPGLSGEVVEHLAEALVRINEDYLRKHRHTPQLYHSRVRYRSEHRTEQWASIPIALQRGYGDCEDLAAWLCAELRVRGDTRARVVWRRRRQPGNSWLYHLLVERGDGVIEDPSLRLGM